jgi:hypothetical protein
LKAALEHIISRAETEFLEKAGDNYRLQVQMLIDLGYLEKEFRVGAIRQEMLLQAVDAFRRDLLQSGMMTVSEIKQIEQVYGRSANQKLLERTIDIDDGFRFRKLPDFGDQNLQTRILHYRLNLLGLYPGYIALPWGAFSYSALENASIFAGRTKLETMNLLADIEQYTTAFLKTSGYKNPLVVFVSDTMEPIPEYTGAFKRQLRRDLRKHDTVFNDLDDQLFFRRDHKVNGDYLDKLRKAEINLFTLRLIQVHQWMAGAYDGLLDGDFGPVTVESLLEVINQYSGEERKDVKPEKVLVRITGKTFLFNAVHFLIRYSEEGLAHDRTLETLQILSQHIHEAPASAQQDFEQSFQSEVEIIRTGEHLPPENRNGLFPRIFTGARTFFKKLFRVARRLFRWIVDQVKKGLHFIRNAIRMIYAFLKEAVIHFINGVRFLLGKLPVATHSQKKQFAYTHFDIDKDVISLISEHHKTLIANHLRNVHQTVNSMHFSLAMIAFLFKTLKASLLAPIPVAWPLFVVKMVIAFKNVIDQYKLVLTA